MPAQAGRVTTQASPISRTTGQRTCLHRRSAPTPTTEEATTCVVLTGAPNAAAPPMTNVLDAWLMSPSSGRIR